MVFIKKGHEVKTIMLAIIPARGGSKGLPGKNIKELMGKPLIAYTIEAALNSSVISRVIVSTDDEKIASVAKKYGAEVPYIRNSELASDSASAIDVYIDAIQRLEIENKTDPFMVLLPTVPFRTSKNIDEAYDLFNKKKARTLISVVEAKTPASWYLDINKDGTVQSCGYGLEKGTVLNRQENKKNYIPNGAIYILDYELLKKERTYYCEKTIPYIMDGKSSVDIDSIEDFEYAEYLLQNKIVKEKSYV